MGFISVEKFIAGSTSYLSFWTLPYLFSSPRLPVRTGYPPKSTPHRSLNDTQASTKTLWFFLPEPRGRARRLPRSRRPLYSSKKKRLHRLSNNQFSKKNLLNFLFSACQSKNLQSFRNLQLISSSKKFFIVSNNQD